MSRLSCPGLLAGLIGLTLAAQTQVDLHTQSKGVDFQAALYTRPLKTSAALPATCTANELLLLTTAPAGNNIYACLTPDVWTPQAGASSQQVTILNSGAPVGARGTENFVSGPGILNAITDLGTKINIQQSIDTSVVLAQADLQAGQTLFCQSSAGSGSIYNCALAPTLTAYTAGMVLFWRPDVNGVGGNTTVNVDLLGAVALVKPDGTNPGATDIVAGELYPIWYDGASFRLLTSSAAGGGGGGGLPQSITSTNAGGGDHHSRCQRMAFATGVLLGAFHCDADLEYSTSSSHAGGGRWMRRDECQQRLRGIRQFRNSFASDEFLAPPDSDRQRRRLHNVHDS